MNGELDDYDKKHCDKFCRESTKLFKKCGEVIMHDVRLYGPNDPATLATMRATYELFEYFRAELYELTKPERKENAE